MLAILKIWNDKYDIWSFFSDFIFVFGVLVLGWSPILLILLLIIDTAVMLLFVNILFHLENKDWIKTIGFIIFSPMFLGILVGLYSTLMKFIEDVDLDEVINADPSQIINSYILPIILVSSGLNHYAEFDRSLHKMKEGTYNSTFIKHFFLKYIFIMVIILALAIGYFYFNATIVIVLIIGKTLLRMWNKKFRDLI
jgi:hypothetical protein